MAKNEWILGEPTYTQDVEEWVLGEPYVVIDNTDAPPATGFMTLNTGYWG